MNGANRVRWNRVARDLMKRNAELAEKVASLQSDKERLQGDIDVIYAQFMEASNRADLYQRWIDVFSQIAARGTPPLVRPGEARVWSHGSGPVRA